MLRLLQVDRPHMLARVRMLVVLRAGLESFLDAHRAPVLQYGCRHVPAPALVVHALFCGIEGLSAPSRAHVLNAAALLVDPPIASTAKRLVARPACQL